MAVSKIGADATEFRTFTEGGRTLREPLITEAHRREMALDLLLPDLNGPDLPPERRWWAIDRLYFTGWSYRLIAQFLGMSNEDVQQAIISCGRSLDAAGGPLTS